MVNEAIPGMSFERTADKLVYSFDRSPREQIAIVRKGLVFIPVLLVIYYIAHSFSDSMVIFLTVLILAARVVYAISCECSRTLRVEVDRSRIVFNRDMHPSIHTEVQIQGIKEFTSTLSQSPQIKSETVGAIEAQFEDGTSKTIAYGIPSEIATERICRDLDNFYGLGNTP